MVVWSVAAASHGDVWAVGSESDGPGQARNTFALCYNGTSWQPGPSPSTSGGEADLFRVARIPGTHQFSGRSVRTRTQRPNLIESYG